MKPEPEAASTGYCLVHPRSEYLVYQPARGAFDATLAAGTYVVEWFNPATGVTCEGGTITAESGKRRFTPPFTSQAVLYLKVKQ